MTTEEEYTTPTIVDDDEDSDHDATAKKKKKKKSKKSKKKAKERTTTNEEKANHNKDTPPQKRIEEEDTPKKKKKKKKKEKKSKENDETEDAATEEGKIMSNSDTDLHNIVPKLEKDVDDNDSSKHDSVNVEKTRTTESSLPPRPPPSPPTPPSSSSPTTPQTSMSSKKRKRNKAADDGDERPSPPTTTEAKEEENESSKPIEGTTTVTDDETTTEASKPVENAASIEPTTTEGATATTDENPAATATETETEPTTKKRKRKRKRKRTNAETTEGGDNHQNEGGSAADTDAKKCESTEYTVYVEGIRFDAKEEDVRGFFVGNGCADVIQMRLARWQDSGRFRGFGHVVFSTTDSRERAIKSLDGLNLNGRYLTIRPPKSEVKKNPNTAPRVQPAGCRTIFIKNLPYDATQEEIHNTFRPFGKIIEGGGGVRLARNYQTGIFKGFAYVEYKTEEGALAAVNRGAKVGGIVVRGRICFVDYDGDGGGVKGSFRDEAGKLWQKEYGSGKGPGGTVRGGNLTRVKRV